jgi:hypothetical protein
LVYNSAVFLGERDKPTINAESAFIVASTATTGKKAAESETDSALQKLQKCPNLQDEPRRLTVTTFSGETPLPKAVDRPVSFHATCL